MLKFNSKVKAKVCFIVNSATCTAHTYRELKLHNSQTLGEWQFSCKQFYCIERFYNEPRCVKYLKGSYDVAKKNISLCIWCNAMCLHGLRLKKNTLFSTYCTLLLLLYGPPFWNVPIFTKLIVLRSEVCSDWPAIQCVVIGRIPQACDENVTPLTMLWCRVPARRD